LFKALTQIEANTQLLLSDLWCKRWILSPTYRLLLLTVKVKNRYNDWTVCYSEATNRIQAKEK